MGMVDPDVIASRLRKQAQDDAVRVTIHAHQEMVAEGVSFEELREVLLDAEIIENYPQHQRGACCLIGRETSGTRYLHVVCTRSLDVAIIITVYEPMLPKWITPFQRGKRNEM